MSSSSSFPRDEPSSTAGPHRPAPPRVYIGLRWWPVEGFTEGGFEPPAGLDLLLKDFRNISPSVVRSKNVPQKKQRSVGSTHRYISVTTRLETQHENADMFLIRGDSSCDQYRLKSVLLYYDRRKVRSLCLFAPSGFYNTCSVLLCSWRQGDLFSETPF